MSKLEETSELVKIALANIERLFQPEVRITFLARTPDKPERDFVLTQDSMPEVVSMCQRINEKAQS